MNVGSKPISLQLLALALAIVLAALPDAQAAPGALPQITPEQWHGIYSGTNKIGHSHMSVSRGDADIIEISDTSRMRINTLGIDQDIDLRTRYLLSGYSLMEFSFTLDTGLLTLKATGTRVGSKLNITVESVSGTREIEYALTDDTLVFPLIYRWVLGQDPGAGDVYRVGVFDPASVLSGGRAQSSTAELTVHGSQTIKTEGGEVDTLKVSVLYNGMRSTAWVNPSGDIVKEESELGLVSLLESRAKALGGTLTTFDIIEKTAISSDVPLKNARRLSYLKVRIGGIGDTGDLELEDGFRQTFSGGVLVIEARRPGGIDTFEIPYKGAENMALTRPSISIQSESPRIMRLAGKVLGGETDSLAATHKLVRWVYKNLEKTPTVSIPNALDVLETMQGDCNEHAVLLAAMLRSAGIPTRLALGVVYIDGRFYYHAWNEVFVGGWLAVDSTFGQVPADASHIRLLSGDLSRSSEISRFVGKLTLDVIKSL